MESLLITPISFVSTGARGQPLYSLDLATKYLDVLKDPMFDSFEIHGCPTVMHDGAPAHKIKSSKVVVRLQYFSATYGQT